MLLATLFGMFPFLLKLYADGGYQRPGEGHGQSLSLGGDRVLDVALGSDRGRLGVLDDGEGQRLRGAGVLRGERPLSRIRNP